MNFLWCYTQLSIANLFTRTFTSASIYCVWEVHMKKLVMPWNRAVKLLLLAAVMVFCLAAPASAATNKALALKKAKFLNAGTREKYHFSELCAATLSDDKLKNDGMTISATLYFPKKALKKGEDILVYTTLYLQDPMAGDNNKVQGSDPEEWPYYYGLVPCDFYCQIRMNSKGKISLNRIGLYTAKTYKAGSYYKLSKKGSYYILKIKDVPLKSVYMPFAPGSDSAPTALITSKDYLLSPAVAFIPQLTNRSLKGNLYVDNLKLVTATKTQTITFNKKDYRGLYVNNGGNNKSSTKPLIRKPMK